MVVVAPRSDSLELEHQRSVLYPCVIMICKLVQIRWPAAAEAAASWCTTTGNTEIISINVAQLFSVLSPHSPASSACGMHLCGSNTDYGSDFYFNFIIFTFFQLGFCNDVTSRTSLARGPCIMLYGGGDGCM